MELVGCPRGSGRKDVVPGVVYKVISMSADSVQLHMLPEYCHGAKGEKPVVKWEHVCAQLRPAFAMCYYTSQGRTIRDRHIVLLDTTHHHMSVRALIVGLSRATHGSYLHVGDDQSEALFAGCGKRSGKDI